MDIATQREVPKSRPRKTPGTGNKQLAASPQALLPLAGRYNVGFRPDPLGGAQVRRARLPRRSAEEASPFRCQALAAPVADISTARGLLIIANSSCFRPPGPGLSSICLICFVRPVRQRMFGEPAQRNPICRSSSEPRPAAAFGRVSGLPQLFIKGPGAERRYRLEKANREAGWIFDIQWRFRKNGGSAENSQLSAPRA